MQRDDGKRLQNRRRGCSRHLGNYTSVVPPLCPRRASMLEGENRRGGEALSPHRPLRPHRPPTSTCLPRPLYASIDGSREAQRGASIFPFFFSFPHLCFFLLLSPLLLLHRPRRGLEIGFDSPLTKRVDGTERRRRSRRRQDCDEEEEKGREGDPKRASSRGRPSSRGRRGEGVRRKRSKGDETQVFRTSVDEKSSFTAFSTSLPAWVAYEDGDPTFALPFLSPKSPQKSFQPSKSSRMVREAPSPSRLQPLPPPRYR